MEIGKHNAVVTSASVYEKDNKLIVAMQFAVGEEQMALKKYFVLFKADGLLDQSNYDLLRTITGWDGVDPIWIKENATAGQWPCECVIKLEPGYNDPSKMYHAIAWVNPVSGGVSMPESIDRSSVLSKYGARLRAAAGPQPVKKAVAPSAPAVPRPAPAPARPPVGPMKAPRVSTSGACWTALNARLAGTAQAEIESTWFALIGSKDQSSMTGNDWGQILDNIEQMAGNESVVADDGEPMPF